MMTPTRTTPPTSIRIGNQDTQYGWVECFGEDDEETSFIVKCDKKKSGGKKDLQGILLGVSGVGSVDFYGQRNNNILFVITIASKELPLPRLDGSDLKHIAKAIEVQFGGQAKLAEQVGSCDQTPAKGNYFQP